MENNMNELLLRQIKKHFGSLDNLPVELKDIIQDIDNTYQDFEDKAQLLQNSIEACNQAEEALKNEQYLMTTLMNNIPDHIYFKDAKSRFTRISNAHALSFGLTDPEQVIGKTDFDFFSEEHARQAYEDEQKIIRTGQPISLEEKQTWTNRPDTWVSTTKMPLRDKNDKIIGTFGISKDITVQKKTEEALSNERALFRTVIDLIPDAVYVKDMKGRKILANPKEVQLAGKNSENEIIGKTDFDLYPDSEAKRGQAEDQLVLQTGKPILDIEGTLIDRKGKLHYLLGAKVALRDMHGKITGVVGVTHDISARKHAEEKLTESEGNFRTFFESIDDLIFITDLQGVILYVNNATSRKLGYTMDELLNKHILDMRPDSKRAEAEQIFEEMYAGKRDACHLPVEKKDGTSVPVETRVWFGKWDGIDAIFRLSKDLTKEQESLIKFNKIFDNNPALMVISSFPEEIFTEVNQAFISKTGYSRNEIIGKSAAQLNLIIQPEKQNKIIDELAQTGIVYNYELKFKTKSGDILDVLFSSEIIESQDKMYILMVMIDITESKKLEEEIKLQNDFYNIASKLSERLIQTNSDHLDIEINRSLEILGIFNHVDRANIFELDSVRGEISNTFEWCASGVESHMDNLQHISLSFIPRWKEVFFKNEHIYIESVSNLPDELKLEKEIFEQQGIQSLLAVPMFYGTSLIGFVSFDSVVDKKHWNEQVIILLKIYVSILGGVIYKKKTEAALIQAKIEADLGNKAKSEFLANMSHEIRTPLNGVIGFTELLQKTPLNAIQRQYTENVSTSGLALLGIINDILDFSKIEAGKMELDCIKTDIIELVEQASDIIKYHASQKGLELLLNIPHNMPRFAVLDPIRLKQILVNLLSNAVKFTHSGEIELKVIFTKKDEIKGNFSFSVQDTGIGINDEQQKRLFKAFTQADSSTTRKFGGSGLGLTISNMLAEKMGSKIEIISEPGKGSNFFFTIETEYEEGEKLHDGSLKDLHRIMVIDDNANNRMILEHTFHNWGIEYVGVDNGLSALNVIEHSKPFDVIIVDYHMPYLNGIDTIRMIREKLKLSPEILPIILLHSSSDDIELYEDCKKLGVKFNLTKPVKSKELLHYLKNIHSKPISEEKERESILKRDTFEITNNGSMVILVAEDVVLNMILVTTIITQMFPNMTILEAKNGKEAFDITVANNPDLILMDVQMPEMDGVESTIAIRNYEKNKSKRIPIIALTAEVIKGEKEKCMEAGMDDFLTKPIEQNALREVLGKYLISLQSKSDDAQKMDNQNNEELHFDRIELMKSIGNSQTVYKELIEAIPQQFSDDIAWLENSIIEKNMGDAKKAVHSIKGVSLGMYFNQMGKLALELEMSIVNNALERLDEQFNALICEWEQIQTILKNLKL